MSSREKVLAIRRIQKEREAIAVSIKVFEGKRWDGFLGGMKGILTFIITAILFGILASVIGDITNITIFSELNELCGFCTGLIFSQCVRNKKNEGINKKIKVLKKEYNQLARTTKEIIYA